MIVQAAKIIGSGLATIGLTNVLLSLLTKNKNLYLIHPQETKKEVVDHKYWKETHDWRKILGISKLTNEQLFDSRIIKKFQAI